MKVVVFFSGQLLPKGGPSGYLFNLNASLAKNSIEEIKIIARDPLKTSAEHESRSHLKRIKEKIRKLLSSGQTFSYIKYNLAFLRLKKETIRNLMEADVIHFHTCEDFYFIKSSIKNLKAKTIFTSHAPVPSHIELQDSLLSSQESQESIKKQVDERKRQEIYAFKKADRLVFPCEGAVEAYEDFFKKIEIDLSKIDYILTATEPLETSISVSDFRARHSINLKDIVVSYIGRKSLVKGFDIFLELANSMRQNKNYKFICAGTGEIAPTVNDNIIDLGWITDPGSLVNASNFILAPNRSTYFDLGILQALSMDKKIVTSATGGNKWFSGRSEFIFLVEDNTYQAYKKIVTKEAGADPVGENRKIFLKYFSNEAFSRNYLNYYKNIFSDA